MKRGKKISLSTQTIRFFQTHACKVILKVCILNNKSLNAKSKKEQKQREWSLLWWVFVRHVVVEVSCSALSCMRFIFSGTRVKWVEHSRWYVNSITLHLCSGLDVKDYCEFEPVLLFLSIIGGVRRNLLLEVLCVMCSRIALSENLQRVPIWEWEVGKYTEVAPVTGSHWLYGHVLRNTREMSKNDLK